ncbi:MAG: TfoX/Sxy family protein [Gemmatimonadales bacterium]
MTTRRGERKRVAPSLQRQAGSLHPGTQPMPNPGAPPSGRPSRDPLLAALLALPRVRTRRMLGGIACFASRRLFAVSRIDALLLRLPRAEREGLLASGAARPFALEPDTESAEWVELARPIALPRHELLRTIEAAWTQAKGRLRVPVARRRRRIRAEK